MSPTTLLIWASASLIGSFRLSVENSTTALSERRAAPAHVQDERGEEDCEAQPADERRVGLLADDADHGGDDEREDQPRAEGVRLHAGRMAGAPRTQPPAVRPRAVA